MGQPRISDREFFVWGLALYLGEGAKTERSGFRLANTDPVVVAAFLRWSRAFFAIDETRLRATMYLHRGLDVDAAIRHWADLTGIPPEQFTKTYRARPSGGRKSAKHRYGCLTVKYHDSSLFRRVMALSEAVASHFAFPG